jgi:ATP-dependent DNA helicase RecG
MASLSDDELSALVARLRLLGTDTATVEVKSAAGGLPSTTAETISAFGNAAGGVLILGLSERDGFRPSDGFTASSIRDALARVCSHDLEPPVRSDVEILPFEDASVVVLDVPPTDPLTRPLHLKRRGPYGGSYIRGGDGDRLLTSYEVTQLLANRGQPTDDKALVPGATLDDLDPSRVSAFLTRLRSKPTRAFAGGDDTLALVRAGVLGADADGALRPTLAGLLCLGAYPQQFFPQLFVSFVALPGREMGDVLDDGTRFLDNVTCDGTIPEILEAVIAAARRNMRTASLIRGAGREDRYDYPTEVIRELVVNAMLHRDYSPLAQGTQVQVELYPDRLLVKSPGGLYGAVVPSQLGVEDISSTRNTVLAKLLAEIPDATGLPVSENRGSGLPTVLKRLREAGMSPPTFDVTPAHVHVGVPQHALLDPQTVSWIASLGQSDLSDAQHLALALMRSTGTASNEMLRVWGVESAAATVALRDLVDRGVAVKLGGRRFATYELVTTQSRQPDLFDTVRQDAPPQARARRVASEQLAVIEAVRAGHRTTAAIQDALQLTYATANRRVNELLADGRLRIDRTARGRSRSFHAGGTGEGASHP